MTAVRRSSAIPYALLRCECQTSSRCPFRTSFRQGQRTLEAVTGGVWGSGSGSSSGLPPYSCSSIPAMAHHLIYHPPRQRREFAEATVYFDQTTGNQDPYVWSKRFLHSYCHATELRRPEPGNLNFWVSGDSFPHFSQLLCDLVFVVEEVCVWTDRNWISEHDSVVESPEAYLDHYRWAHQHRYKRRHRRTLKADPGCSYQPQRSDGGLIDILPHLDFLGLSKDALRKSMTKGIASKPLVLSDAVALSLSDYIANKAAIRLTGDVLYAIRAQNPGLQSFGLGERPTLKAPTSSAALGR